MKSKISRPKNGYDNIEDIDVISWQELVQANISHLKEIETESILLIKEKICEYSDYIPIVPVSTGKDSMVTIHLVREIVPDAKAIFNNTTLDCADTYVMAKSFDNCQMMTPKEGFYQWQKRVNWVPSRIRRGCCSIFKTGEMVKQLDHNTRFLIFLGMRNEESNTRSGYGDEIVNPEWGKTEWQGILPIRKWTELDIWLYTIYKNLQINSKYRKGYSRVGCAVACPFYTKSTWILDKYWYPTMRNRWEKILEEYFTSNSLWASMNCTIDEFVKIAWNGGIFREEPTEDVIQEYAQYQGLDIDVARKYFNKYCSNGCTNRKGKPLKIKDKNVIAMNMKYHGRDIEKFLCKKCFMQLYGWNEEKWNSEIERFKQQGCALF